MDKKLIGVFFTGLMCGYFIRFIGEPTRLHEKSTKVESTHTSSKDISTQKIVSEQSSQVQEKDKTQSDKTSNNIITETTITRKDGTVIHSKRVDNSVKTVDTQIKDLSTILASKNAIIASLQKQQETEKVQIEEKERIVEKSSVFDFGGGISLKGRLSEKIPESYKDFGLSGEIKVNPLRLGLQGQVLFDGTTIVTIKGWW